MGICRAEVKRACGAELGGTVRNMVVSLAWSAS